jgi:simple sugar transport system ATP-binding protein
MVKYFSSNGITALDHAGFDLRPGEIHALLGENGAGKSTLMHIMAGYLKPGAGRITLDQRELRFAAPADALAAGIGMVRQHPRLTPGFTVWEDCVLGTEPRSGLFINRKKARDLTAVLSARWGFNLPPDRLTDTLTVSQRQKAAILAMLLRDVKYLVFDEPASVLTPHETAGLFKLLRLLKAEGKGIVLISHKLEETLDLAGRVTVLRKGRTIASGPAPSFTGDELRSLMFGGTSAVQVTAGPAAQIRPGQAESAQADPERPDRDFPGESPALLSVTDLSVEVPGQPLIRGVNLVLAGGTILGIAGVRDSGLETLELTLTGFLRPAGGRILLKRRDITGRGPRTFRGCGGAYLNAGGAMAPGLSLGDNIILHAHRRSLRGAGGRLGIMDRSFLNSWTARVMGQARVPVLPKARGDSFSGGMLQRAALARELAENAALLVLAEPGRGLDRQSRDRLTEELRAAARKGRGVLIFSTDVDELLSAADEILVLRNGFFADHIRIAESPDAGRLKERIGRAMVGEDV